MSEVMSEAIGGGDVVTEEADSGTAAGAASISNNASSTRTTSTATTSQARQMPTMTTTTTTRSDNQANVSIRESEDANDVMQQANGRIDRPVLPPDLTALSPDQLRHMCDHQQSYTKMLEQQVTNLKEEGSKLKDQLLQATRRENILILRLTTKDKALLDLKVSVFAF